MKAGFQHLSGEDLRAIVAQQADLHLTREPSGRYWANLVVKDHAETLTAESHDTEDDLYIVLEGAALLRVGGELVTPAEVSHGQWRASAIAGGETRRIAAGDFVVIPHGMPHMLDARAGRIVYLVIKESVASEE